MSCNFTSTFELAANVTYGAFDLISEICPATYLRPDPGGSMIPWIGSLLLLVLHLPTCVIRAVKWESAQYLALGLATLGIALTVQAYVSTGLKAAEVLVWMPLTLVLDAGAMLQMVVLIFEKHDERHREWREDPVGMEPPRGSQELWNAVKKLMRDIKALLVRDRRSARRRDDVEAQNGHELQENNNLLPPANNPPANPRNPYPDALRYAFVALFAFLFLVILVILQIYGLYAAVVGRRQKDIQVKWCSPAFRDFAIAVTTGNCEKFSVRDSSSNGIGCIVLQGDQQRSWLIGTIIALCTALVCQVLDTLLMLFTNSGHRWRGVKAQRPWLTMFGGVIMLVVLIVFGVFNAKDLPKSITETVWIYRKEPSRDIGRVCKGLLNPPGLRGVMIGYMDGLFESWGGAYSGRS